MTEFIDTPSPIAQNEVAQAQEASSRDAPNSNALGTTAWISPHRVGSWGAEGLGPTLIAVGGIHGNEPAGAAAIERVLSSLASGSAHALGRFVGLVGNPVALAIGTRFLDVDLNRAFTAKVLEGSGAGEEPYEHATARTLCTEIRRIVDGTDGPVFVIDLHTTSSRSTPFVLFSDRLRNRAFAAPFRLPMILGLEEVIEGALLDYLDLLGVLAVGVEGGRHDDPDSVDNLEAVLWVALVSAGVVAPTSVDDLSARMGALSRLGRGSPRVLEVRYRHAIRQLSSFQMIAGFSNLDRIRQGQPIANEAGVRINAPESGRLLLPRYQALGSDGFFIARPVSPIWLRLSAMLRRLKFDRLLPLLPGVSRDPDRPRTLVVDTRVASLYPLQVLHLLGYRRLRWTGRELVAGPRDS